MIRKRLRNKKCRLHKSKRLIKINNWMRSGRSDEYISEELRKLGNPDYVTLTSLRFHRENCLDESVLAVIKKREQEAELDLIQAVDDELDTAKELAGITRHLKIQIAKMELLEEEPGVIHPSKLKYLRTLISTLEKRDRILKDAGEAINTVGTQNIQAILNFFTSHGKGAEGFRKRSAMAEEIGVGLKDLSIDEIKALALSAENSRDGQSVINDSGTKPKLNILMEPIVINEDAEENSSTRTRN